MVASNAILSQSWTVTPNFHNTFVSLNDSAAVFIFQNFTAMTAGGWTLKWTCDGTTGPTSAGDTTNRLASKANCTTRGAAAGNAQSFFVVQNTDGVQVLVTYQGASDDIVRLGFSKAGYTLAGTTNQQPTASDEVAFSVGNTIVGATASADRVLQIWTAAGGKAWSCAIFRSGALVNVVGVERINSQCGTGVFTLPYVGYRLTSAARSNSIGSPYGGASGTAVGTAGNVGVSCRVFTASTDRLNRLGGGEITVSPIAGNSTAVGEVFNTTPPATLAPDNAAPFYPLFWSGEKAANLDGPVGWPADWWVQYTSSLTSPAAGTFSPGYDFGDTPGVSPASPRTNWFVAIGSAMVRPWRNAAAAMDMA